MCAWITDFAQNRSNYTTYKYLIANQGMKGSTLHQPQITIIVKMVKMGRTKNYLRYVHDATFGIVAASQAGASIKFLNIRNTKDRFIAVPANENVLFWDLKTKQLLSKLRYEAENAAEVTVLECYHGGHPRTNLIAIGYANGHVRVFEYETGVLKMDLVGHRTGISALAFDHNGSRLSTGGKDCNVVVWDLVSEKGLYSLKGHKNCISKLAFLRNQDNQKDLLVSGSIDPVSTIKFWDLQTQHCCHTVPGHASGVWSFVLLRNGTRLVSGTSGPELRVYSIDFVSPENRKDVEENTIDDNLPNNSAETEYGLRVLHMGNILRNSNSVSNRVEDIIIDEDESVMLCHSIDKNIELYKIRSSSDALTYAKKLAKKSVRRQAKRKQMNEGEEYDESMDFDIGHESALKTTLTSLDDLHPQLRVDCEFNKKLGSRKLSDKVKAMALVRSSNAGKKSDYKLAVMASTNKINTYILDPNNDDKDESLKESANIENLSHRADVKAVSISSDNTMIMSSSAESVKIWRLISTSCISTVVVDYATCCVFANAQNLVESFENRFGLIGTKHGTIQIVDFSDASVIETVQVSEDKKAITCISTLPDRAGIVCGSEDGFIRFYNYTWKTQVDDEDGQSKTLLALETDRNMAFQEGITCVKISSNSKLLAVSLLDSTVRVHFLDTFKYFLTMYGHKFPVTTMDISDDNTLIATGSLDKNIKIWGLDFGDCHKSIFAHEEGITCVRFVPKTHHLFSSGRDKAIKQWDCDLFIRIQALPKHQAEVWCLDVSPNGKHLVTGSRDKSIRLFRKSEEILVPTEEEETERELDDERNVFEKQENIIIGETNLETGFAPKMTVESIKSTDRLIEALDVFGVEQERELEYQKLCEIADSKGEPRPPEPEHDPLLMTAMTNDYNRFMLEILRRIRPSELEEILLTLPFDYVKRLMEILVLFLEKGWDVELMTRCCVFLLKVNFGQIASCSALVPVINKLKSIIMDRVYYLRDCSGFNMLALEHLSQNKKYVGQKTSNNRIRLPASLS